jgi:hypothetical protein
VERGNHSDGDTDSELLFTSRSDLMPEALLVQEDLAEGEAGGRDSVDSGFSGGLLDDAIDGIWDGSATGVVECVSVCLRAKGLFLLSQKRQRI